MPHEDSPAKILRAKSHSSQTSHPQTCVAPMSCDRRQNACWHLRCNTPSEEGSSSGFFMKGRRYGAWRSGRPWHGCNDTQLVRCFGAMLRLFRRLVAHTASDLASSSSSSLKMSWQILLTASSFLDRGRWVERTLRPRWWRGVAFRARARALLRSCG